MTGVPTSKAGNIGFRTKHQAPMKFIEKSSAKIMNVGCSLCHF